MITGFNKFTHMKQALPWNTKAQYYMNYFLTPKSRTELCIQSINFNLLQIQSYQYKIWLDQEHHL